MRMVRSPGVASLAGGIGLDSALFSAFQAAILEPCPSGPCASARSILASATHSNSSRAQGPAQKSFRRRDSYRQEPQTRTSLRRSSADKAMFPIVGASGSSIVCSVAS